MERRLYRDGRNEVTERLAAWWQSGARRGTDPSFCMKKYEWSQRMAGWAMQMLQNDIAAL